MFWLKTASVYRYIYIHDTYMYLSFFWKCMYYMYYIYAYMHIYICIHHYIHVLKDQFRIQGWMIYGSIEIQQQTWIPVISWTKLRLFFGWCHTIYYSNLQWQIVQIWMGKKGGDIHHCPSIQKRHLQPLVKLQNQAIYKMIGTSVKVKSGNRWSSVGPTKFEAKWCCFIDQKTLPLRRINEWKHELSWFQPE